MRKASAPSPTGLAVRRAPGERVGAARSNPLPDNRSGETRGSSRFLPRAIRRPLWKSSPAPGSGEGAGSVLRKRSAVFATLAASSAGFAVESGKRTGSPSGPRDRFCLRLWLKRSLRAAREITAHEGQPQCDGSDTSYRTYATYWRQRASSPSIALARDHVSVFAPGKKRALNLMAQPDRNSQKEKP